MSFINPYSLPIDSHFVHIVVVYINETIEGFDN